MEDVEAIRAWEALSTDERVQLVDVRTEAEWKQVGLPDLRAAGKSPILVSWQFPTGMVNPEFIQALNEAGLDPTAPLYFLCRSGVRSRDAAIAAAEAGFAHSYNVADGFEGPPDPQGRRGTIAGWQAAGLPWRR